MASTASNRAVLRASAATPRCNRPTSPDRKLKLELKLGSSRAAGTTASNKHAPLAQVSHAAHGYWCQEKGYPLPDVDPTAARGNGGASSSSSSSSGSFL